MKQNLDKSNCIQLKQINSIKNKRQKIEFIC